MKAYVDPLDFALTAKGINQTVQAVADDSIDPSDSRDHDGFGELICNGLQVLLLLAGHVPRDTHLGDFASRNLLHAGSAAYLNGFLR
jgi:hypothetical protein